MTWSFNNGSNTRRNRKSKKSPSSPIKRNKKMSVKLMIPKGMSSANPKMLAKKKRPSKRISAKRVPAFKSKPLMPSILINGKKVSLKAMKKRLHQKSCFENPLPLGERPQMEGEKPLPQGDRPLMLYEKQHWPDSQGCKRPIQQKKHRGS